MRTRTNLLIKYLLLVKSYVVFLFFGIIVSSEPITNASVSLSSGKWNGQRHYLGQDGYSLYGLNLSDKNDKFEYLLQVLKAADSKVLYLDGSYVSLPLNNWDFGYGLKEMHWSPSNMNSLILSRNARPFQSLYLKTNKEQSFDSKYLNWLGKWGVELFIGSLEQNRHIENAKIAGARFKFQPLDGLEIDLVRTAQFGGAGRSESLKTIYGFILGQNDNGDEANQLAGLGVSYEVLRGKTATKVYGQVIGEDEAGYLPTCHMYLAGFEVTSLISTIPTKLTIEGLDTVISYSPNGWCGPTTAYNNSYYPTGYTHHGKVMGASIDTASRALIVSVEHKLSGYDLLWSVSKIDINVPSLRNHRLSNKAVSGYDFKIGTKFSLSESEITSSIHYQDFELNTAKIKKGLKLSLNLTRKF